MGNRSIYLGGEGCELVETLIPEHCSEFGEEYGKKQLIEMGLGEFMNDWKLQGYWYKSTIDFLGICAKAMTNLTEDPYDNYLEFEEEQGFRFKILFYKEENGNIKVKLDAHVMDTYEEDLWDLEESRLEVLK
jgi:hypothetical protein